MPNIRPIDWVPVLGFGLLPVIAIFANKGTVIVLALCGLTALFAIVKKRAVRDLLPSGALLIFGLFAIWMVITSFISHKGEENLGKIAQVLGLVSLYFLVSWQCRVSPKELKQRIIQAMQIGTLTALGLLVASYLAIDVLQQDIIPIDRGSKISILYPGLMVLAFLFPSLLSALDKQKRIGLLWVAGGIALALSLLIGSITATILIGFSLLSFVLFRRQPGNLPKLLALVLVVFTLTAPISMPLVLDRIAVVFVEDQTKTQQAADQGSLVGSLVHRYHIWRFAADAAAKEPFFGWGFDASRSLPGGHKAFAKGAEMLPLHPHNAILQVWLELGVPGLIILAMILWRAYMPQGWETFSRREILVRAETITVIFIAANATFGMWQSWWIASIALALSSLWLWHDDQVPA